MALGRGALGGLLAIVFVLGAGSGAGAFALARGADKPAPKPKVEREPDDQDEELLAANASLVKSLAECNRRLAAKGEREVTPPPAASVAEPAPVASSGRRGGRGRDPMAAPDWNKLAEEGAVPFRIPCIRSTPFVPSERQLDRLGLAPQDGETLKQAYAKSNERMNAQIAPLCARVLGSKELAEKVGAQACMSAIIDSARRESPDKMKAELSRVAEVNGGKRPAPKGSDGLGNVEALMLAMTEESKTFERDLAAQLGPEEAARIASSRGLCSERGMVRATDAPPPREGRDGR